MMKRESIREIVGVLSLLSRIITRVIVAYIVIARGGSFAGVCEFMALQVGSKCKYKG